jgi:AcrR family transcriptional regulator
MAFCQSEGSPAGHLRYDRARTDARERGLTDRFRTRRRSRRERKQQTRRALLDAALDLLSRHSFDSISLREVARGAGISPTAFYRHFDDLEELGLVLVEEAFGTLHDMVREARADTSFTSDLIRNSVAAVVDHLREHRPHLRFIARERYGGVRSLRRRIRTELELFAVELAVDLGRFPELEHWSREDRLMYAELLVDTVVTMAGELLDARPEEERRIARRVERQLRLTVLGVPNWRSRPAAEPHPVVEDLDRRRRDAET